MWDELGWLYLNEDLDAEDDDEKEDVLMGPYL